jgi:electron transfer flavoprotein alpha subunit
MSESTEKEPAKKKPRGKARLIEAKCIACGARCQIACPADAIEMNDEGEPIIDKEKCIGCRSCVKACPADALEMVFTPEEERLLEELRKEGVTEDDADGAPGKSKAALAAWKGVWVFVEQHDGKAHPVSWELMGAGRRLADDLELAAVVLGFQVEVLAHQAFGHGADKTYLIDDPLLRHYRTTSYLEGTASLVRTYTPEIVLMGATALGRDLAGAVATELSTGLTADCIGLTIDKKMRLLEQTRPAFGGNIMATILTENARPQMASVRPYVLPRPDFQPDRSGELIRESIVLREEEIATKLIEIIPIKAQGVGNIAGARVIVSGGRGMGGPENFRMLENLADLVGGVVGCSRSAVDAGWMPPERQVGQTGKTVRPKLYIACGISGAIQHLVGMQDSDYIIAINTDTSAPIFEVANLAIVGDVVEIVPAMIEKVREMELKPLA